MSTSRYPQQQYRRVGLAPGILGAVVALAAVGVIGEDWFTIVRYALSILAAILAVFSFQARQWWWLPVLAAVIVVWNPVFPLALPDEAWFVLQYAVSVVFLAVAFTVRLPVEDDRGARNR
ncbi:DUF6804 family protein [Herbiconiux sp. SYSU D00978]|uniref:DUF6804 family protein n=1 Tax=Herbiconiux sp. SYSU D00978 TaxID=2812562 RepID=UPI001A96E241|nr:DUF6804 family protein [Herbiconiux sp. SYSU D00978]